MFLTLQSLIVAFIISMIKTGEKSGYWVVTDQDENDNRFLVFDRTSFDFIGAFRCQSVQNTDGITISQTPFGQFPTGLFFAVHNDGGVGAVNLQTIKQNIRLQ
ncbi:hypothetical protein GF312_11320 [Candidatus Poribacteria bacterium]|nr:hypothetical protein [Candidatus Poribacteria bacterium]